MGRLARAIDNVLAEWAQRAERSTPPSVTPSGSTSTPALQPPFAPHSEPSTLRSPSDDASAATTDEADDTELSPGAMEESDPKGGLRFCARSLCRRLTFRILLAFDRGGSFPARMEALRMHEDHQVNLLAVSSLPASRLLEIMRGRRSQEDAFKHGAERWGFNALDGRATAPCDPDTIVPNPARRRLDRALRLE